MRCGKGHEHESVQAVRDCYGVQTSQAATAAVSKPAAPRHRTNRYAQECCMCRLMVAENAGILFRSPGVGSQRLGQGDWLVRHPSQEDCQEAALLGEIKDMQPQRSQQPRQAANFKAIPQGYYATRKEHGINFWFVRVPDDGGKWDGYRFVRRIVGGGSSPIAIHQPEQLAALHAILEAGVDAAGNLFADEMEQCKWCRKPLTRKASRELRCGSTCAGNRGLGEEWARLDALYDHQ